MEVRVSLILHDHFILKNNHVNLNTKRLYIHSNKNIILFLINKIYFLTLIISWTYKLYSFQNLSYCFLSRNIIRT